MERYHFRQNLTFYPLFEFKFEIKAPKFTPKPNLSLIRLKLGKLEFLGITKHENDDDVFHEFEVNMTHMILLPSFNLIWLAWILELWWWAISPLRSLRVGEKPGPDRVKSTEYLVQSY